jgi:DNA-binding GntR family transcriptional regulator
MNLGAGASGAWLAAFLDLAHDAVARGDRLAIAEAHAAYHERIVEPADNELLSSIMRGVLGRMTWLFYLTAGRDPATQSHEHDELLEVIVAGNDRLAESLAFAHIERGR